MLVGRVPPADVAIADPGLSRRHARFELTGKEISLEDLGSTNGTLVNGEPVERSSVRPGDEVSVGTVTVSIHSVTGALRGFESHGRFLSRLEDEVARARFFKRGLALLLVRLDRPGGEHLSRAEP